MNSPFLQCWSFKLQFLQTNDLMVKIIPWQCQAVNGRLRGSRFLPKLSNIFRERWRLCEVAYFFLSLSREAFVCLSPSLRKGTTVTQLNAGLNDCVRNTCNLLDDCSKPDNRQISRNMQISRTFGPTRALCFQFLAPLGQS